MLFCCLKGSYDVIKRIIVTPSFIAYTFFGSILLIFSHHDVDMWGRVWMSHFRGAWTSLYFYKEYLFGFETLVFATSGILSVHEQLVTLQRERKTWNMTPLRNIMYYIYIYIYLLLLFCLSKMCSRSEGKHTLFVSVPVEAWYWRAVPQPTVWTHWFGHLALSTSSVLTAMDRWVTVAMW